MSNVKPAARADHLDETVHQPGFCRAIEIDHHVPAEDGVERALERPWIEQIELPERNERTDLARNAEAACPAAAGTLQVAAERVRYLVARLRRIFAPSGLRKDIGV